MFNLKKIISKFDLKKIHIPQDIILEEYSFSATGTTNGYYESLGVSRDKKIVIFGMSDQKVFEKYGPEKTKQEIIKLSELQKVIIYSCDFDPSVIKDYVKETNMILLASPFKKRTILSTMNSYISHKTSERVRVHGSLVNVFGEGVLIIGKSGIGKSEITVDLISAKHSFVGDDAIDIFIKDADLYGQASDITKDFIEIRGIGIINVRKTFGIRAMLKNTQVNLVIELVDLEDVRDSIERLGTEFAKYKVLGREIPKIQIPLAKGRSLLTIIESAVTVYKHRKYEKYVASDELSKTIRLANLKK